ncbi:MAG TPA: DUF4147 domain-containing protein [Thermoanaerobaculia bacterium]|nr:DUF4147 domain-containing protein [Thermoanaerobaculia bacterium]HUM28511.1 DUF4147 domain-containing protein [Thermoanaerobaculia bacterium]HXK66881.1 DUF4147 domain-containing protein [Thermoanaerobaculia bacterium]
MIPFLTQSFMKAVEDCRSSRLVKEYLTENRLPSPPLVLSLGKSAQNMAQGVWEVMPESDIHLFTSRRYLDPADLPGLLHEGDHPVPGENSYRSGRELLNLVTGSTRDLLFLVSGGGSSMVEMPLSPWISEPLLTSLHARLIQSPLSIEEANCLRKHTSAIKGGRLSRAAERSCTTLICSDVPGNRPDLVASGPTVEDPSTLDEAERVLETLKEWEFHTKLEVLIRNKTLPETPKPASAHLRSREVRILADNSTFLRAFASRLTNEKWHPAIVVDNRDMPAEEAVDTLITAFLQAGPGQIILAGGEFPPSLHDPRGRGGRCTHLAAVWSARALGEFPDRAWTLMAAATDGQDGTAPSGGVILSRDDLGSDRNVLLEAIASGDTYPLWKSRGTILAPAITGINLRDLVVLFVR